MAAADYWKCEVCTGKTFYDANLDFYTNAEGKVFPRGAVDLVALCSVCAETFEICIKTKVKEKPCTK